MAKGLPRSLSRAGAHRRETIIKRTIPVRDLVVTVSSTGAAIGFGDGLISDFEEGNILLLGAVANLSFAGSGSDANLADDWEGDFGIGTTPADDATITGTDVDIIPSTAIGPASSEVISTTRGALGTPLMFDNTDGSLEINLNILIDAVDITDDESVNITVNGELYIAYIPLGDD